MVLVQHTQNSRSLWNGVRFVTIHVAKDTVCTTGVVVWDHGQVHIAISPFATVSLGIAQNLEFVYAKMGGWEIGVINPTAHVFGGNVLRLGCVDVHQVGKVLCATKPDVNHAVNTEYVTSNYVCVTKDGKVPHATTPSVMNRVSMERVRRIICADVTKGGMVRHAMKPDVTHPVSMGSVTDWVSVNARKDGWGCDVMCPSVTSRVSMEPAQRTIYVDATRGGLG